MTHSASVAGLPLSIRRDGAARISFDSSRSPHVVAELECAMPDAATLAALDPRQSPAPRVSLIAGGRACDLHVREVPTERRAGTISLTLASDEALVDDWAPMVDDRTPLTLQASLKAVCQYVIRKIDPTAVVSGPDADITAYWSLKNICLDPRGTDYTKFKWGAQGTAPTAAQANTTGISSVLGSGATTATRLSVTTAPSGWVELRREESVTQLETYSFSVAGRYDLGGTTVGTRTLQARLQWMNRDGASIREDAGAAVAVADPGAGASAWTRVTLENVTAPRGAAYVRLILRVSGLIAGSTLEGTLWQIVPYRELVAYYDGYTPNDPHYAYTWDGDPNGSTSSRTPTVERDPDSLVIAAGVGGMTFLAPLVQAQGLRLVCDESRAWTLRNESYRAPGSLQVRQGVNLREATDKVSRDADLWYDAAVRRYRWTARDGTQRERVDSFALTATPSRVNLLDIAAPYPGPGRAEYAVRRAQGRGREITAACAASWSAAADQEATVMLAGALTQLGATQVVELDLIQNDMTIRVATTEVPAGAIDLLTGTIDALTGTIDSL